MQLRTQGQVAKERVAGRKVLNTMHCRINSDCLLSLGTYHGLINRYYVSLPVELRLGFNKEYEQDHNTTVPAPLGVELNMVKSCNPANVNGEQIYNIAFRDIIFLPA